MRGRVPNSGLRHSYHARLSSQNKGGGKPSSVEAANHRRMNKSEVVRIPVPSIPVMSTPGTLRISQDSVISTPGTLVTSE